MEPRPFVPSAPRLTAYGLWLVASRLGGPVLVALVLADIVRCLWG